MEKITNQEVKCLKEDESGGARSFSLLALPSSPPCRDGLTEFRYTIGFRALHACDLENSSLPGMISVGCNFCSIGLSRWGMTW